MKLLSTLFLSLFISLMANSQVIYVDHEASGANDGSSWADAYTDLTDALENAMTGDAIWIADGTYLPGKGSADSTSTFMISTDVTIIGGFNGTETSSNESNRDLNPVILSGDHLDNDGPANDLASRTDNSWHVITIDSNLTRHARIGGVFIQNGSAFGNAGVNNDGGGILALGWVMVNNCVFRNNGAVAGGAISLPISTASASIISDSEFEQNYSGSQGACIFTNGTDAVSIQDCNFNDNVVNRGVVYPLRSANTEITGCTFSNNGCEFIDAFGGALFNWNSFNTKVTDCQFSNNGCGNGGASYVDGREIPANVTCVSWDNCTFSDNAATDWGGGAIYAWKATQVFRDCKFTDNMAPNTGGAMYLGGTDKGLQIIDCEFEDNSALGGWGGAHAIYGDSTTAVVLGCYYSGNMSVTSGGAVSNGFLANVSYGHCEFEANSASFGGAAYLQNDSTQVSFEECTFFGNTVSDFGGAINISGAGNHSIDHCLFELNVADNTAGALAVSDPDDTDNDITTMRVMRCSFQDNISQEQAGAIYLSNVQMDVISTRITDNSSLAIGAGGAISHNASGADSSYLRIVNSTIANNVGTLINGISSWTESDTSTGEVILVNSIVHHEGGDDWGIEAGSPTISSLGGNLVSNANLTAVMTGDKDLVGNAPGFVDDNNGDYHLDDASVCVNSALTAMAPGLDLDGNMRLGEADKGAYENQNVVSNKNLKKDQLRLDLAPNPVDQLTLMTVRLPRAERGFIKIYTASGKLIHVTKHEFVTGQNTIWIDASDWPSGQYVVELIGKDVYGQHHLIKM